MFAVQEEGILVQQDNNNFLRFDVEHNGTSPVLFAAGVSGSTATTYLNTPISSSGPPFWLRVQRTGDTWTESWSLDGTNFTTGVTFNYPLNVTEVGPFVGNSSSANGVPALTASIDYFFNTASPLSNLDGPLPFTRIVIDPNPPPTTLEKGLGDIDGDGRLDAVIGFGNPPGTNTGDGLVWYENPHSGNPADPWLKHTILASGVMYEDLKVVDVNGDGAPDVIASFIDGTIYWFENPRGFGGNPATDAWPMTFIGTGSGENNMELADMDGDGKMDLVTNSAIFFQNNPNSWTTLMLNASFKGLALLDIGSGQGAINIVGLGGTAPYSFIWQENPRSMAATLARVPGSLT